MVSGGEYIALGVIFALYTGLMEFVFDYPVNAFGMSLGIIFAGVIILLNNNIYDKGEKNE